MIEQRKRGAVYPDELRPLRLKWCRQLGIAVPAINQQFNRPCSTAPLVVLHFIHLLLLSLLLLLFLLLMSVVHIRCLFLLAILIRSPNRIATSFFPPACEILLHTLTPSILCTVGIEIFHNFRHQTLIYMRQGAT